jgi:hypothetical protein
VIGVLAWFLDRLPNQAAFGAFVWIVGAVTIALPLVAAFVGARWLGKAAGVAAMIAGWTVALYVGGSMMALFGGCRFDGRCNGAELFHGLGDFFTWAAEGVLATLPWQIAWIAAASACLYAGLRLRRRKLAAA